MEEKKNDDDDDPIIPLRTLRPTLRVRERTFICLGQGKKGVPAVSERHEQGPDGRAT